MHLTACTDYALRTLLMLAGQPDRLVTIEEVAASHRIPKNHLTKVVHRLGLAGFLRTVRGRHGGIALARTPAAIHIGAVVRALEQNFHMAACFDPGQGDCLYAGGCGVQALFVRATAAWLAELDGVTLADIARPATPPCAPQPLRRMDVVCAD
jgi:Rrf2 family nitric oxide-sensitive transcriptional repressor